MWDETDYDLKHMKSNSHAHFTGEIMNLFELKRDFVLKTSFVKKQIYWNETMNKIWIAAG